MADQFDGGFVEVYSAATGEKQSVPAHFLDNEVLMKGLRKTPLSKSAEKSRPAPEPTPDAGNTAAGADTTEGA